MELGVRQSKDFGAQLRLTGLIKTLPLPGGNHVGWLNTLLGEELKQQRSGQPLALLPDKES